MMRLAVVLLGLGALAPAAAAQGGRPRAEVTPVVESTPARAGDTVRLLLQVRLPEDVHVQAHEPRDPSLIPTVLTVEAPPGTTVDEVIYPPATDLTQAGRREPLAVLGPEFAIGVRLVGASDDIRSAGRAGDAALPGLQCRGVLSAGAGGGQLGGSDRPAEVS